MQDELIDRFGEYPDVVGYLLEIGLAKAYLDKVLSIVLKEEIISLSFNLKKYRNSYFLTQDYFQALSQTNLKANISENQGLIEVVFDIRNKKDYEILEGLLTFGESLAKIKDLKESH